MLGCEVQKQHESVPVCSDGARTQCSLLGDVLGKERLYQRWK